MSGAFLCLLLMKTENSLNASQAAFFDVDGTLTTDRVWRGLMDYFRLHKQKRLTHLVFVSLHYPLYFLHRAGLVSESGFRTAWASNLGWYLRGMPVEAAERVWDWIVSHHLSSIWRNDVRAILTRHRETGSLVVLVSSGPEPLIRRIAAEVGADLAVGTRLEVQNGRFTGRSLKPVCINEHKASQAQARLKTEGLEVNLPASYAYADSTSDRYMLEMVGYPTATYPNASLYDLAVAKGWVIFPENYTL